MAMFYHAYNRNHVMLIRKLNTSQIFHRCLGSELCVLEVHVDAISPTFTTPSTLLPALREWFLAVCVLSLVTRTVMFVLPQECGELLVECRLSSENTCWGK